MARSTPGSRQPGNANVDVVERFHLVEYGALTWLYYRAWHARGDVTSLVFPALATFMVGIFDEGLQWLVPARVGELRDVLLNGVSIACGLVFSVGLEPVTRSAGGFPIASGRRSARGVRRRGDSWRSRCSFTPCTSGTWCDDAETGDFFSRYSADELLEASRDRAARWQSAPPRELRRTSIEDHYLAEGVWHVQRRNEVEDPQRVWHENLILEKYFGAGAGVSNLLHWCRREVAGGAAGEQCRSAGRDRRQALSQHRESVSDLHLEPDAVLGLGRDR